MRYGGIKARNMGLLKHIDIDFSTVRGPMVAITGENGAGKSTLLELLAGGLSRQTPTRGSLVDLATGRDSFLEVSATNGSPYVLRHVVDAVSKRSEAVAMDVEGRPLTEAGKVREFDAWAAIHLPAPEVLFASTFAPQGSGGFLELKSAERKRVLLRVLGVERLELVAEAARKKAAEATNRARVAEALLASERERVPALEESERAVAEALAHRVEAAERFEAAAAAARDAERAAEDAGRVAVQRRELAECVAKLEAEALAVRVRRNAAEKMAGRADEVRLAREKLAATEASLTQARADLAQARERLAVEQQRADARRGDLERAHILTARAEHLRGAVAGYERELEFAGDVEAAAMVLPGVEAEVNAALAWQEAKRSGVRKAEEAIRECERAGAEARAQLAEAQRLVSLEQAVIADADTIRARALRALEVGPEIEQAQAALDTAEREVLDLRTGLLESKDQRLWSLRGALTTIAGGAVSPQSAAGLALEQDDVATLSAESAPACIAALEDAIGRAKLRLKDLQNQQVSLHSAGQRAVDLDESLARLPELAASETRAALRVTAVDEALSTHRAELARGTEALAFADRDVTSSGSRLAQTRATASRAAAVASARASRAAAVDELGSIDGELPALLERTSAADGTVECQGAVVAYGRSVDSLEDEATFYRGVLADSDAIAAAAAQVEAADRDAVRIEGDLATLRSQLADLPSGEVPDVDAALTAAQSAHAAHAAAERGLVVAEERLTRAQAGQARLAELQATVDSETTEVSDWTRVAQDTGRDGIQAMMVDAAGPELTAIANDLLHTCVSRRWTMDVRTQRTSADGKRQLEGCDVVVLDTVAGREAEATTFSGGERVLLGEALSLALSVVACRRLGVVGPTLVRDESGAALDAENGRAYVAMLRRAADLIGASQVLYVSHTPELQELADARIHVEGGTAVVIGGAS